MLQVVVLGHADVGDHATRCQVGDLARRPSGPAKARRSMVSNGSIVVMNCVAGPAVGIGELGAPSNPSVTTVSMPSIPAIARGRGR